MRHLAYSINAQFAACPHRENLLRCHIPDWRRLSGDQSRVPGDQRRFRRMLRRVGLILSRCDIKCQHTLWVFSVILTESWFVLKVTFNVIVLDISVKAQSTWWLSFSQMVRMSFKVPTKSFALGSAGSERVLRNLRVFVPQAWVPSTSNFHTWLYAWLTFSDSTRVPALPSFTQVSYTTMTIYISACEYPF